MPRIHTKRGLNWGTKRIEAGENSCSYFTKARVKRSEKWRKARNERKRNRRIQ